MGCNRLASCLDAFLDGDMPDGERRALETHVRDCADCGTLLARERRLQRALKAQPVSEPGADVLERALSNAVASGTRHRRTRWLTAAVGGALAAGFALWMAIGAFQQQLPATSPAAPVASVTMTLHEPRTIQLVFAAPAEIENARLSLSLPPGVELVGHDGRREIRWRTTLQPGKNVLPLALVMREGDGGELVARLSHGSRQKVFRVRVMVRRDQPDLASTHGSTTA
ncbi:MAG: anti-sigma factor family protein [Gammaproteobacteria bacterium]